jgi:hypothetical protein
MSDIDDVNAIEGAVQSPWPNQPTQASASGRRHPKRYSWQKIVIIAESFFL